MSKSDKYTTGKKFEYYKGAYKLKLARKGIGASPVVAIFKEPGGHNWVDENSENPGEVLTCSNCFQKIALCRYSYDELGWTIYNNDLSYRFPSISCSEAIMRRALL